MPRYREKPRDDREDREDRRRHERKRKGRLQTTYSDYSSILGNDRERLRTAMTQSSQNDERHKQNDERHKQNDERHKQNDERHKQNDERHKQNDERHKQNDERHRRNDNKNDRNSRNDRNERRKFSHSDSKMQNEPSPEWGNRNPKEDPDKKPAEKDKPNFGLSGKLTEDANTVNGVVIKYSEPQDARKPKRRWRLYPFKGEKTLPTLFVHRQSAYLMGRDRKIADIPLDHPSCSKQHAVLQYRLVTFQREGGGEGKRLRPYLIDLESANGTFVNNVKLEPKRFHELLERDVLKFGFSSREYVLLHEQSRDDALDDDVPAAIET